MKKVILVLLAGIVCLTGAAGQDIPANDAKLMDNFIGSMLTFRKVSMTSETLDRIFTGSFYTVTPTYNHEDGTTSSCEEYKVVISDGKLSLVEELGSDRSLPVLFSLLKPGTTIKDEGEANVFEAALDVIYPLSWSDEESDKKHLMKDGKWLFLRGDFFGSKKGFIVTIGQDKKITNIDFSLKAVEQQ